MTDMDTMMRRFTLRDREPFGPLIVRSRGRGVLHRAQHGPVLHVRCTGGRPFRGDVLSADEAAEWATGHLSVLCRYPWCFRQAVRAAGLDPAVGHSIRPVSRQAPRVVEQPTPEPVVTEPFAERRLRLVRERADRTWHERRGQSI